MLQAIAVIKAHPSLVPTNNDDINIVESAFAVAARDRFGEIPESSFSISTPEIEDSPSFIPYAKFPKIIKDNPQLNVAPIANVSFQKGNRDEPFLLEVIKKPWEFFDRKKEDIQPSMKPFLPPVFTVLPTHPDYKYGWAVVIISPMLSNTPFPAIPEITYLDWAKEFLRNREVWKAVMKGAVGPNPRCPHKDCRIHRTGLCHGWFPVPKNHRDCDFNYNLRETTKHQVSKDGKYLEPYFKERKK